MDREEARELLLGYSRFINEETDLWEALDLAIEALQEPKDTDCISKQQLLEIKNKAIENAYSVEDEDGGVVFCIRGADDLKEYLNNLFSSKELSLEEWQELDRAIRGDEESATTTDCKDRGMRKYINISKLRDEYAKKRIGRTGRAVSQTYTFGSKDCISRADLLKKMKSLCPEPDKDCGYCHKSCDIEDCIDFVVDAPSVTLTKRTKE